MAIIKRALMANYPNGGEKGEAVGSQSDAGRPR